MDLSPEMFAWIAELTIHIFSLLGFRDRLSVLADWAWVYLRDDRGARLIKGPVRPLPRRNKMAEDERTNTT